MLVGSLMTSQTHLQRLLSTVRSPVVDKDILALLVDDTLLEEVSDLMLLSNSPLEGVQS